MPFSRAAIVFGIVVCVPTGLFAQESLQETTAELRREATALRAQLERIEKRLDQLEQSASPTHAAPPPEAAAVAAPTAAPATGLAAGTTVNLLLDTYYEYNFNAPIGRVNLLRAFDVSSNSFSLNQAALVVENAPNPDAGKRWGARVDLQWGQATQTLQGNAANEARPEIYRALFQAYGTYVLPIGKGLTADFGKWASSIGIEGNYTKDQMNYSRSFWFDYLPFYHMGLRLNYNFNDRLGVHYWVTNGTQQTEAFNGFKDQSAGFNWQPSKTVNWTFNYYLGQEHPDAQYFPNGAPAGLTNLPSQQGIPFEPIRPAATGRLHIFDSYVTWQPSAALSFAADGDWVIERNLLTSAPQRTDGGTLYARYQFTPKVALAARAEYLSDAGGLFSGAPQTLKETTITAEYKLADSFLLRWEWRRDLSNRPFFYSDTLGLLKPSQTTAGVGLVWWFGEKKGTW